MTVDLSNPEENGLLDSRASDALKTWGEMTDAEKGALLLAHHEGKVIENNASGYWMVALPVWEDAIAYRIRPEPKVETVVLYGHRSPVGWTFTTVERSFSTDKITLTLRDGKPDRCAEVEELNPDDGGSDWTEKHLPEDDR